MWPLVLFAQQWEETVPTDRTPPPLEVSPVFAPEATGERPRVFQIDAGNLPSAADGPAIEVAEKPMEGPYELLSSAYTARVLAKEGDALQLGFKRPGGPRGIAVFESGAERMVICAHAGAAEATQKEFPAALRFRPEGQGSATRLLLNASSAEVERAEFCLVGLKEARVVVALPWAGVLVAEQTEDGAAFVLSPLARGLGAPLPVFPCAVWGGFCADARAEYLYAVEAREDGFLYRFIPAVWGDFSKGGRWDVMKAETPNLSGTLQGRGTKVFWVQLDFDGNVPLHELAARARGSVLGRGVALAMKEGVLFGIRSLSESGSELWTLSNDELRSVEVFKGPSGRISALALAPDGSWVMGEDSAHGARLFIRDEAGNSNAILRVRSGGIDGIACDKRGIYLTLEGEGLTLFLQEK